MPVRRPAPGDQPAPATYDSLDGQVALVTGANRGIGHEIATRLADRGATVFAGARRHGATVPDGCERVTLDVTQRGDMEAAINRIGEEAGRLDVLVNNAAVSPEREPITAVNTDQLDRSLSVNLRGPMLLAKYALPAMLETDGPRIVNVSSNMGKLAGGDSAGSPGYRITKTGINGLTGYLHREYAADGLLANSVTPGWVATDMGGQEAPRTTEKGAETPVWLASLRPETVGGAFWKDREVIEW